jgi:NHLM bacteriocin system ABC transporter ATP-binding protein
VNASSPPEPDDQEPNNLASRLKQREQQQAEATHNALSALASVARPPGRLLATGGPPMVAALRVLGEFCGIQVTPPRVIDPVWTQEETLRAIERSSHIRSRRVMLEGEWWKKDCGAILAFAQQDGRPQALLPQAGGRYLQLDPSSGAQTFVDAPAAGALHLFGYVFYRPFPEKIHGAMDVVRFSTRAMGHEFKVLSATALAGALLGMLMPIATGVLFDTAIPDANRSLLFQMGLGLIVAALGKSLFDLLEAVVTTRISTAMNSVTQAAVWDRLLKLHPSFLRRYSTGDLVTRAMAISTIFRHLSVTGMRAIFGSFVSLINLALMFYYSWRLAVIGLAGGVLILVMTQVSGVAMLRLLRPLQELEGRLFGITVQLINGISKLRVSGTERFAFVYWGKRYSEQQKLNLAVQRLQDQVSALNQTIPTLATAMIFLIAGAAVLRSAGDSRSSLLPGDFLAFSAAFGVFISSVSFLSNTGVDVLHDLNLWRRSEPILSAEPEMRAGKSSPGSLEGAISISHVTFRYQNSGRLTLDDVTVEAKPGEFIAIVGPSGSGKSTLLRLLLGFETPASGTVQFDGQDLNGLDPLAVRRQLGVVLQSSNLLAGSIFENIAAGVAITLDQAWDAARRASIAPDIESFPMGMHTFISEGANNISMGQRQRLLIARALVFKPRILLFDEATSALDNRAQAVVSRSLDSLKVTRVVVAHRLSTIRNADRIYVMQAGRVVETGSFAELAAGNGLFSRVMARQVL